MQDGNQKVLADTEIEQKINEENVDYYSLSPEKLDEALNGMEVLPESEDESPETDEISDTEVQPETDTKTEEPEKLIPPEPEKTEAAVVKIEEPLIDEAFISKYDKDGQKVLQKYIGKPISEIVKALANANELIGKKSTEVKRELFPQSTNDLIAPKTPIVFPKDQKAEEAEALMNKIVLDKIAGDKKSLGFSDDFEFPPNLDIKSPEYKAWYKTVNYDAPADLKLFESAMFNEKQGLKDAYTEVVRLREEYKQDNDKIIDVEVDNIMKYFAKANINLKEYGVDFDNSETIEKLIFVEKDGKKLLDDEMFTWVNGEIPILKKGAIATKFMNHNGSDILAKIRETSLEQGRREGAELSNNNKKPVNKGLGNSDVSGQIKTENHSSDRDPYTLSLADLDREITYQMSKE